jgi:hypothetical protein
MGNDKMANMHSLVPIGEEYLKSWERHDLDKMRQYLALDVHFKEPLSEITGRDSFLSFAQKNLHLVKEVRIRSKFESGSEAVLIYDFVFVDPIGSIRTAARLAFQNGKIRDIELFYDPRHLQQAMSAAER